MADDEAGEMRRAAAMHEAALHETLHHPNVVTPYSSVMQPVDVDVSAKLCHATS